MNGATRRSVLAALPGPRRCWKSALGLIAVYIVALLASVGLLISLLIPYLRPGHKDPDAGYGALLVVALFLAIVVALVLVWAIYNLASWPLYPLTLTVVGLLVRNFQENGFHLRMETVWWYPFNTLTALIASSAVTVLYGVALRGIRPEKSSTTTS
jgi:hypothetical protein